MPDTAKTLSAAQLLVLTAAARRPEPMALPPPAGLRVRGGAKRTLLASLLERGLVEERPIDDAALSWRRDGRGRHQALRITAAGLAAVGGAGGPDRLRPRRDRRSNATEPERTGAGVPGGEGRWCAWPSTPRRPTRRPYRRRTQGSRRRCRRRAARPGGKLGRVLDAVAAEDGATLAELAALTGWQPHTTRAALTRLRRRGFDLILGSAEGAGDRKAYRAVPA